jgi:cellulose synthase/poly-beta-1,6-N-acetylglucosamine synthase-like glycosyltransferase
VLLFREHGAYFIVGFALAVTAPLLVELLVVTLAAMMPRHERTQQVSVLPKLGRLIILVPSHNEEINVGRCVESISASAGGPGDILVIAHNCTDRTAENAAQPERWCLCWTTQSCRKGKCSRARISHSVSRSWSRRGHDHRRGLHCLCRPGDDCTEAVRVRVCTPVQV